MDNRPILMPRAHPINSGNYLFATREIKKMIENTNLWIENRTPGAIIYGNPRLGKTKAIKYTINVLNLKWGDFVDFYSITTNYYAKLTERIFFEEMLRAVGHPEITKGTIVDKRNRLTKYLVANADQKNAKKIVFFIDEAQRLKASHFDFLMDIYNELYANGISLTTILVGQPELKKIRQSYFGYKDMIRERFMNDMREFHGIRNETDLKICLSWYDRELFFPKGSEWSFTRYFFPQQFKNGFRLEQLSDRIFDTFWRVQQEYGRTSFNQIPMHYVTNFVETFLKSYGIDGENLFSISDHQINEIILLTSYANTLKE